MKSVAVFLLALAVARAAVVGKDHPIVKVINLLNNLKEKTISEGKEEAVAYEKFTYWCSTTKSEVKDSISGSKETIDELEDAIAGKEKEQASLEGKIEKLDEQIKDLQVSAKTAKDDRAEEARLYSEVSKDLADTIKAVDGCIKALEGAQTSTEGKMLLAQSRVKSLIALISVKATETQLKTLVDFAGRPDQLAAGDKNAHVDKYDFKSENVVELLKQLMLKFEDDKLATTKAETNSLNAYALSKEARDNSIDAAVKSNKEKGKQLAAAKRFLAESRGDLKNENADLDADSKALSKTDESCATKASEWDARSKTRSSEIEALDAAVEIMGKATGVRTTAPGNPIPPASPVKLLQISESPSDPKMKAVALLRQAAKDGHSRALERLAVEVAAHLNGPFDAVNNMIEKMIFRLMAEQKDEDDHKNWCDKEIEKTNTMVDDKDDKIKDLSAEIKVQVAAVAKLTEDMRNADKMISDITSFMKEATEIRNTGKNENTLAIKDAQDAQTAVTNAISVLEAFYKDSGAIKKEAWESLIQAPTKIGKNPSTWGSSYSGVADPTKQPGGIVAVLENVNADFSKMEAETKSQEQVDQMEFEESMKANGIEKARRSKESEMKSAEKARRADKISSLESSKKLTTGELEKTNQYLKDLRPACVDGDTTYADRKASRAKEVEALKTAQVTLLDAFKEKGGKFIQAHGIKFAAKAKLDNNQKVYIENQPVLGDGAGEGALNVCRAFAPQHVSNPAAPAVRVCGTGIKMTAFLRGECNQYYEHSRTIGKCDTGMPPSTCDSFSPADDARFGHYQSYKIEPC